VHLQYGTQEKNRREINRLLGGKIKSKKEIIIFDF
tara:strand:- start:1198 stop:1302 length:105 start_codon:yes stop_codon:yes gene_type:complete